MKIDWDFIISALIFQTPTFMLMIIAYNKNSYVYHWYIITLLMLYMIMLAYNAKRITRLEKQIKELQNDIKSIDK